MDPLLPDEVRRFIRSYIPTVGHLELLLFLFHGREKRWEIQDLAREMRTNESLVTQQLERLAGPVRTYGTSSPAFQFANENLEFLNLVQRLSETYRSHRYYVIEEIYHTHAGLIKSFVSAFKKRKR